MSHARLVIAPSSFVRAVRHATPRHATLPFLLQRFSLFQIPQHTFERLSTLLTSIPNQDLATHFKMAHHRGESVDRTLGQRKVIEDVLSTFRDQLTTAVTNEDDSALAELSARLIKASAGVDDENLGPKYETHLVVAQGGYIRQK